MKKKLISIMLATFMAGTLITGCANTAVGSTGTAAESSTASQVSESSPVEEIPTLKVFAVQESGYENIDINENDAIKCMEEEIGVNLDIELVPEDVVEERLTLAITSNDLPDVFFFCSSTANKLKPANLMKYGQSGVILALDDIIEEKIPNLYSFMMENFTDGLGRLYETDGHIYSTPDISSSAHMEHYQKVWTNQAFLDALGMDMPQTLDEYEAYLKGVIEQDVNGNGYPNDEIGLVSNRDRAIWYRYFMNSFVYTPGDAYEAALYVDNETKQVMCSNVQDGWREGLRWINSLWSQGLIYEETFTLSEDQLSTLFMSEDPIIAGIGDFAPFLYDTTFSTPTYPSLVIQTPLSNNGEAGIVPWSKFGTVQVIPGGGMITKACKDVDAACRFLNYYYDEENLLKLWYGFDYKTSDKYVTLAEEGERNMFGDQAFFKTADTNALKADNHAVYAWGIRFNPRHLYAPLVFNWDDLYTQAGASAVLQLATDTLAKYTTDKYSTIPNTLRMNEEDAEKVADIQAQLDSYVAQWDSDFIMGNKSLDDDWDAYVEGMYNLGLQDLIDAYQAAITR